MRHASRWGLSVIFYSDLHGHRMASAEVWLTDGGVSTQLSLAIFSNGPSEKAAHKQCAKRYGRANDVNPRHQPQSSSASRFTGSHTGFLHLSQSGERPERYVEALCFDTISSKPILQACANTVGPSALMCSLSRSPGPALARTDLSVALRYVERLAPQIVAAQLD